MRIGILLFTVIWIAAAQDVPAPSSKLTADQAKDVVFYTMNKDINQKDIEIASLKTENAALRAKLLDVERVALLKSICDSKKIPLDHCGVDPKEFTAVRLPDAPVAPVAAKPEPKKQGEK